MLRARLRARARARARVRVRLEHRDEADRGLSILVGRDRICSARLPARRPLLLHTRFGLCATAGAASQERYAGASAAKSGMRVRVGAAHNPAGHGGPRRRSAAPAWATRVVRCDIGGGLVACAADAEVKVEKHGTRAAMPVLPRTSAVNLAGWSPRNTRDAAELEAVHAANLAVNERGRCRRAQLQSRRGGRRSNGHWTAWSRWSPDGPMLLIKCECDMSPSREG